MYVCIVDKRQEIGKNIAMLIKSTGKSQAQIARELGIRNTTISEYIAGKVYPSMTVFLNLCKILDCSYDDILGKL